AAKDAAELDLRSLMSLVTEIEAATTLVEQVMGLPDEDGAPRREAKRVAQAINSRTLAEALETGRWSDANLVIETIRPDLDKLADSVGADPAIPESIEDAYRVLNVRADTPLESIKTILTAYRRIWHPDRARDDAERALFTLKTQRLNV